MGAEGRNSEAAVGADADALETSRTDARVLLWFATREGKKVDKKVLHDVVNAESNLRHQERTWDNEAKFWTAYRDLAAAVKPASVESILSTCEHPFDKQGRARKWFDKPGRARKLKFGNARKTKRRYTCWAVGVLITLLLIQTYWFVVTAFSANLEKHRDELDRIAGDLRLMTVLAEQIGQEPQINSVEQIAQEEEPDAMLATNQEQEFNRYPQLLDLIKSTIKTLLANDPMLAALVLTRDTKFQLISVGSLGLENKRYRKQRLIAMIRNERSVLQQPWKALWYLAIAPTDDDNGKNSNGYKYDFATLAFDTNTPQREFEDGEKQFWDDLKKEQEEINEIITDEGLEKVLSQSKSIPQILSQYFLPMLYGLLGSLTYILRTLSREIHDVTFTRASAAGYSLRWPLGMLAGVTIGLFFDPTRFAGLAAITPLGIAFLAGYGVELFFTGLDGLVRTFTRRDGPERPKAEAT